MATLNNLSPLDVARALEAGEAVLVDVREPHEFASEHIAGAVNMPLSSFHPSELPDGGPPVILQCAAGVRSVRAWEACQAAGVDVGSHMAGGIKAWIAAGLPVER